MSFKIGPYPPFHISQKMKKNVPFILDRTDKKALTSVNQASEKSSTIWYVRGIDLSPTQENKCPPVPAKLSSDRVNIISVASQAPPRSNDKQKKAFRVDLSDVTSAKNALKSTDNEIAPELNLTSNCSNIEKTPAKNTPSLPPPQKNISKTKSAPVTVSASFQRKVSFQVGTATTKDPETSSSETSTIPIKSILKKTSSFNNMEENTLHNTTDPFTKTQNPLESNEKSNEEEELKLALDELNVVLKDLGVDPL